MRYSAVAAVLVGSAAAAYMPAQSTVTSTAGVTITSCPPDVPNCPLKSSPTPSPPSSSPVKPVTTGKPSEYTTSTVYSTNLVTVTKCPPTVPDCPASAKTPVVSTVVVAVSTTVCPVGPPTDVPGKPVPPPVSSPVKPVPPPASSPAKPVSPPASSPVKPVSPPASSPAYCATYTETCTVTVTAPSGPGSPPKGTAPPVYTPTYKPTGGAVPYPSGPATYSYSTGSPVKPSSPVQFTGAASHVQAGALAGAGLFAAFFL